MRLVKRVLLLCAGLAVVAVVAISGAALLAVRGSLPQLDGELGVVGAESRVEVLRDANGVVTIRAGSRRDAAFATGFVHAQERFFQMDLMRRLAAGELAELVGEAAADHDVRRRVHRMRSVAGRVVESSGGFEREIVTAYTAGVNAGLEALNVRPFEYLILGEQPAPWRIEDTVLVVLAMYFRLHDELAEREARLARLHHALPGAMFEFVTQSGTSWDAPIAGGPHRSLPVPDAGVCDVRRVEHAPRAAAGRAREQRTQAAVLGSNAFALGPSRTRERIAMVATDMHLGLSVPNIWFRQRLQVDDRTRPQAALDVTGVALPGTPAIVAGSNGWVAWGFTNTYGDWVDRVELELDPRDARRYRTASGYRSFDEHTEVVRVRGAEPRTLTVRSTVWGPVIDDRSDDRAVALRWLAHYPQATNLGLLAMEGARDVEQAMQVANRSGIPPQNVIVVDRSGDIAWTVMGRMPLRAGYDPRLPGSSVGEGRGWLGWLPIEDYPRIVNPPAGALWSANARPLDGAELERIGDGGFELGARAAQIRDALLELEDADETHLLAIQLDDRALFLERWRSLLLGVIEAAGAAADSRRQRMQQLVAAGAKRAAVDDVGYRLVRAFRREVAERVWRTITSGCGGLVAESSPEGMRQWEGPLWRMLEERPAHLLDARYGDWQALLLEAADAAAAACPGDDLERCTWGEANVLSMRHPLTRAIPVLSAWLDMRAQPLPGDTNMPRVQASAMGASQRFAVSPGREQDGIFHMPGGQSGHPLSPYYDAGHRDWVAGEPTPFLPGPPRHVLALDPAR